MQWMRSGIPNFLSFIRPLADLLEKVYTVLSKRAGLAAVRVSLEAVGRKNEHDDAFCACKRALENQITLVHVDSSIRLGAFTDASYYIWACIVTQTPVDDSSLSCVDQRHEPLAPGNTLS